MSVHNPIDPYVFGSTQRCYGCGPHNPLGLRLRFVREGDEVITRFTPGEGLEGPPRVFHGGLQATLADEVAGWACLGLLRRMGFTTSLDLRYIRPAVLGEEIEARARIASRHGSIASVSVRLLQRGKTVSMGTVHYMLPDEAKAAAYLGAPVADDWRWMFREPPEEDVP